MYCLPPLVLLALATLSTLFIHPLFFIPCVLLVADLIGRTRDYLAVRDQVSLLVDEAFLEWHISGKIRPQVNDNMREILYRYRRSFCGRWAAVSACKDLNRKLGTAAQVYYHSLGYRWYHLTPDKTFQWEGNPFLNPQFWLTLWKGRKTS